MEDFSVNGRFFSLAHETKRIVPNPHMEPSGFLVGELSQRENGFSIRHARDTCLPAQPTVSKVGGASGDSLGLRAKRH